MSSEILDKNLCYVLCRRKWWFCRRERKMQIYQLQNRLPDGSLFCFYVNPYKGFKPLWVMLSFIKLHVETEVHYISVAHDIFFAFDT